MTVFLLFLGGLLIVMVMVGAMIFSERAAEERALKRAEDEANRMIADAANKDLSIRLKERGFQPIPASEVRMRLARICGTVSLDVEEDR